MQLKPARRRLLFELFFFSGFCGLLYQIVWMRLAFASFGIVTAVVSVVISVFMLGLALGSVAGGRLAAHFAPRIGRSGLLFYAAAELVIGIGAFAVPPLFSAGELMLHRVGEADSVQYMALSAVTIAAAIFPWCVAMGATFPLMMGFAREHRDAGEKTFSYLYLANVIGACVGALLTAGLLVELLGFRKTLWVAGFVNFLIAAASLAIEAEARRERGARPEIPAGSRTGPGWIPRMASALLFTTGLASLAMEVVWTRAFGPVLGSQVYAFAALLVVYLLGTLAGSFAYRRDIARSNVRPVGHLMAALAFAALLPILLNDPRLGLARGPAIGMALASILPLCALLGYLTPRLVDDASAGEPAAAGRAYAINVIGCILGPLIASYLLLPWLGAGASLVVLALPFVAFAFACRADLSPRWRLAAPAIAGALALASLLFVASHENPCVLGTRACEIRRDHVATVVSYGEGRTKRMLVNGVGITELTPITKFMAHLPLAFHGGEPRSGLVICFGMGTTYRSMLSWNVRTTAVELVPSVRDAFAFYHADGEALLRDPRGAVVIDDGRRFLDRTKEAYDVIVVDPPPPVEAAGSSLLYSREFHRAVREHLKPGGVFQTWFPFGEEAIARAIAKSLVDEFPHVRVFRSVEGWGFHFLASARPLERLTPEELAARLPPAARADLAEWAVSGVDGDIRRVLSQELPVAMLLPPAMSFEITDDRPFNEYYILRRLLKGAS